MADNYTHPEHIAQTLIRKKQRYPFSNFLVQ